MKVNELISRLQEMDQDAEVLHLWDGELRTSIEHVYMGKTGDCVTADNGMVAYSNRGRPVDAPDEGGDRYWETPDPDVDEVNDNG